MGGNIMSHSSREMEGLTAEVTREHVPRMLSIIADSVINPLFLEEELEEQKAVIEHEIDEIEHSPAQFMPEVLHHIALEGNLISHFSHPLRTIVTEHHSTTR